MIGDVTPIGWPAGQMRRKRGPLRILLGLALIVGGAVAIVIGITGAINARGAIEDDAVARAPLGQSASFQGDPAQKYTVYVIFSGGVFSDDTRQDAIIARTDCEVRNPESRDQLNATGTGELAGIGSGQRFSGSRQGTSVTLGSASTVGRFTVPGASQYSITCTGPTSDAYVVTPGGTGVLRSVLQIIAGAFAAVGGVPLLIWGLVGRRVPV